MGLKPISERLVLRKKIVLKTINPVEERLYRKLRLGNYELSSLDYNEQKEFCEIVQFKTTIDLTDILKGLGIGNSFYKSRANNNSVLLPMRVIFKKFAEMFVNNVEIDYNTVNELCEFWNDLIIKNDAKILNKVRIGGSKTYIQTAILFAHTLHFYAHSIPEMKRALEILVTFAPSIPKVQFNNSIIKLFSKFLDDRRMSLLFSSRGGFDFLEKIYYKGSKHEAVFNGKVKNLYIKYFAANQSNGEKYFETFKISLSKWFDSISREFTSKKPMRETCGLKLISKNKNCNSLIEEYFSFLSMQKIFVGTLDLIKETWWVSFADHVRHNLGYPDFWKIKSQVDKTKNS